jgi:class 3 adenylate cyclase
MPDSGTSMLTMGHVLFMDIVGYSNLPMDQQRKLVAMLQETVRQTSTFLRAQRKQRLICLPTGDGIALVFFGNPEYPARCAVELSQALRGHPEIKLRMGIHSGPVYQVDDINANHNVSGGGINVAQRVMDCGDEGHILVSEVVADMLVQVGKWDKCLHDLGETEVKHGLRVHLYNLHTGDAGNEELPQKMKSAPAALPVSQEPAPTIPTPVRATLDAAVLDSVSKELATYIGPIAKVLVKRAADRCLSVDDLYAAVAVEIECEQDRASFLAGKKRRG